MFASNETDAVNAANMEQSYGDDSANATGCDGDNHHQPANMANRMDVGDPIASTKTDLSNLKVTVGIDEDLQMILEMDPSIVDLVRRKFYAIFVVIFPPVFFINQIFEFDSISSIECGIL